VSTKASKARRAAPQRFLRAGPIGLMLLAVLALPCLLTLPWSVNRYDAQKVAEGQGLEAPSWGRPFGSDQLGRSVLWRCLLGGAVSLGVGAAAACIAVGMGVAWGACAGYLGGRVDAMMMRAVDVLYGLPYILLVVLLDLALRPVIERGMGMVLPSGMGASVADVATLLIAIGGVSWLTMARVIRGQVMSLRAQPFVEAARACGFGPLHILRMELLPNLVGPIVVYATLTVPTAILQESFLSFLGIGVQAPLPSWGNLAANGIERMGLVGAGRVPARWWLVAWPCLLLALTLLALHFVGDALRARFEPRSAL
jgi:oligopeptide transport system permease protein